MKHEHYIINNQIWRRVTDAYGTCIRYELVSDFFKDQKKLLDESNS